MRLLAAPALVLALAGAVRAETLIANSLVAGADPEDTGGSMAVWGAHELGPVYVGGELALSTLGTGAHDLALQLNVIVGHAAHLGHGFHLLTDVGAGPCEQLDVKVAIGGGDDGGFDHARWTIGAVARAGLFLDLGRGLDAWWALGLTTEVRTSLEDSQGSAAAGLSLLAHL